MGTLHLLGRLIAACGACALAACATFVAYTADESPSGPPATIQCYSRYYVVYMESCGFQAIDGLRPGLSQLFTNTSKVLPGPHWMEIAFESHFGGGGGITDVCAFDLDFEADAVYQVKAHSLTTEISALAKHGHIGFYRGSLDLAITKPSGATEDRRIAATCSAFGGSMCRKDDDCVHHPDIGCFPQDGFPFGQCRFRDRDK